MRGGLRGRGGGRRGQGGEGGGGLGGWGKIWGGLVGVSGLGMQIGCVG